MVNKPWIRPAISGGGGTLGRGWLEDHPTLQVVRITPIYKPFNLGDLEGVPPPDPLQTYDHHG